MGKRPEHRMPVEERAKQFMPFAALKGLNEALAAAERRALEKDEADACSGDETDEDVDHI